jgi:tetratricopeptide (TPR) repeat protein
MSRKLQPARAEGGHHGALLGLALWTALGAGLVLLEAPLRPVGGFLLNLGLVGWLCLLMNFPHEVSHALAARLLGLRVFRLTFGQGRLLWQYGWGRTRLEAKARLFAGAQTEIGYPSVRWLRLRHFLVVAAGPLFHLAMLSPVLTWRTRADLAAAFSGWPGPMFVPALVLTNAVLLVLVLLPLRERGEGGHLPSDGRQLLATPFLSQTRVEAFHARYLFREGQECLLARHYDEAGTWFERGLGHYPADARLTLGLATALLHRHEAGRARAVLAPQLARPDLNPALRALLADAAAESNLQLVLAGAEVDGAAGLLAEAEGYCREALGHEELFGAEQRASFRGTLGAVLVEQGRTEQGEVALRQALGGLTTPEARAWCLLYLALVAARQGRPEQARGHLEEGRRLNPEHPALARVARELAPLAAPAATPDLRQCEERP